MWEGECSRWNLNWDGWGGSWGWWWSWPEVDINREKKGFGKQKERAGVREVTATLLYSTGKWKRGENEIINFETNKKEMCCWVKSEWWDIEMRWDWMAANTNAKKAVSWVQMHTLPRLLFYFRSIFLLFGPLPTLFFVGCMNDMHDSSQLFFITLVYYVIYFNQNKQILIFNNVSLFVLSQFQ